MFNYIVTINYKIIYSNLDKDNINNNFKKNINEIYIYKMSKSKSNYIHRLKLISEGYGKKSINEESIYNGSRGLTMKYYCKDGNNTEELSVIKKGDKYSVKFVKNGKKEDQDYNEQDFYNLLKSNKNCRFMYNFLKSNECKTLCENKKHDKQKHNKQKKHNKHDKHDKHTKHNNHKHVKDDINKTSDFELIDDEFYDYDKLHNESDNNISQNNNNNKNNQNNKNNNSKCQKLKFS